MAYDATLHNLELVGEAALPSYTFKKESAVATVTVRIPESLLKRAQATTGQRDAASAVRRALEIATRDYELKAAARRALGLLHLRRIHRVPYRRRPARHRAHARSTASLSPAALRMACNVERRGLPPADNAR